MSDKNPYYSIPKALGEPKDEFNIPPIDPMLFELNEQYRKFLEDCHAAVRRVTTGRP